MTEFITHNSIPRRIANQPPAGFGSGGGGGTSAVGPPGTTDNAIALFDGTSGQLLKESPALVTIDGSNNVNNVNNFKAANKLEADNVVSNNLFQGDSLAIAASGNIGGDLIVAGDVTGNLPSLNNGLVAKHASFFAKVAGIFPNKVGRNSNTFTIPFNSIQHNDFGVAYNPLTGALTPPLIGMYWFQTTVILNVPTGHSPTTVPSPNLGTANVFINATKFGSPNDRSYPISMGDASGNAGALPGEPGKLKLSGSCLAVIDELNFNVRIDIEVRGQINDVSIIADSTFQGVYLGPL